MVRLLACDVCGSQIDVVSVAAAYNPIVTRDLCAACRRDLQDKRDAAAMVGKTTPPSSDFHS